MYSVNVFCESSYEFALYISYHYVSKIHNFKTVTMVYVTMIECSFVKIEPIDKFIVFLVLNLDIFNAINPNFPSYVILLLLFLSGFNSC